MTLNSHPWAVYLQVDTLEGSDIRKNSVQAMIKLDWAALFLMSVVVAFTTVGELKDIELCDLAISRAAELMSHNTRVLLVGVGLMRRFMFLPALVSAVPRFVMFKGGDSVSICFNTVTLLFLCDIDNLAYAIGISESARHKFDATGQMKLSEAETATLARSKLVHIVLIPPTVIGAVIIAGVTGNEAIANLPIVAFLFGGRLPRLRATNVEPWGRRVLVGTGQWLCGFVAWYAMFSIAD
jgi:hypothetical protein